MDSPALRDGGRGCRTVPIAAAVSLFALQACGGDPSGPAAGASLQISPPAAVLAESGMSQQFRVSDGRGAPPSGVTVDWMSSEPGVVAVDGTGLATAVSEGFAWVIADVEGTRDSAAVVVGALGEIEILPVSWSLPAGASVSFQARTEQSAPAPVRWTVNGVEGGNAEVGTITTHGVYTAPGSVPSGGTVTVAAVPPAGAAAPASAAVRFTTASRRRISHTLWVPRVVDPAVDDSVDLEVVFEGYPDIAVALAVGSTLTPTAVRDSTYRFRIAVSEALAGYEGGDLHGFVGFLRCVACVGFERANLFVNVADATVPAVDVVPIAADMQGAPHVVNIRYDDLILGGSGPGAESAAVWGIIPTTLVQRFYSVYPDTYDFLAVVEQVDAFTERTYWVVRNAVRGVGLSSSFDRGDLYGSSARLLGIIDYPLSSYFDLGERAALHEIGHQWAVYLNGPSDFYHWPVSSLGYGIMGVSLGGGQGLNFRYRVRHVSGDRYALTCDGPAQATEYNDMELYLMGLLPADSVGPHAVFRDQQMELACGATGEADVLTIDDVVAANGPRVPGPEAAPRDFRIATLVLSRGGLLTGREMDFFDHMAARGEATTELRYTSGFSEGITKPFFLATGGRATLTTRIRP